MRCALHLFGYNMVLNPLTCSSPVRTAFICCQLANPSSAAIVARQCRRRMLCASVTSASGDGVAKFSKRSQTSLGVRIGSPNLFVKKFGANFKFANRIGHCSLLSRPVPTPFGQQETCKYFREGTSPGEAVQITAENRAGHRPPARSAYQRRLCRWPPSAP